MNTNNAENQEVSTAVFGYQKLAKEAERKLKKYLRAQAAMDSAMEEWEAAQKAANEAVTELRKTLK
jgi:hypothetical protein